MVASESCSTPRQQTPGIDKCISNSARTQLAIARMEAPSPPPSIPPTRLPHMCTACQLFVPCHSYHNESCATSEASPMLIVFSRFGDRTFALMVPTTSVGVLGLPKGPDHVIVEGPITRCV